MTLTNRTWALLCAALMFCPTVALEIAMGARQAPDNSPGWLLLPRAHSRTR
jgi:hypothetical protein